MSTQYTVHKDDVSLVEVDETSSKLSLTVYSWPAGQMQYEVASSTAGMSPEELVRAAVKMIQPALYNVSDPKKFFERVVMGEIRKLFV